MIPSNFSSSFSRHLRFSLLVSLLLLVLPLRHVNGCIFLGDEFEGYSFLDISLIDDKLPFAPYLVSFASIANAYYRKADLRRPSNVEEWSERHCRKASTDDIAYLVYHAPVRQLQELKRGVLSKKDKPGFTLLQNAFARFIYEEQCLETIDYLLFARACQPHVVERDFWDDTPKDIPAMQELINQGKALFLRLESHYIRLRYAYQIIRLAHYMGDYQQTLELYDYLMPKIDADPSILDSWILGHKAGALMGLGQNVEASYLYSLIFEDSPSRRESAWLSFRITTDEEWEACLALCLNDRQRAGLHVLRAHGTDSRLLEEMQHIYDLDPGNPNLELLLVRELQRLEKELMSVSPKSDRHIHRQSPPKPRDIAGKRAVELLAFVKNCSTAGKVTQPGLWQMAQGYLEMLTGDFYFAARTLEAASGDLSDPKLRQQVQGLQKALEIQQISTLSDSLEREIAGWYNDELFEAFPDLEPLLEDKLARLYRESGHPGKAFRIHYPLRALKWNPDLAIVEDLIALCNKDRLTPLEKKMVVRDDGSTIINDLYDLKASALLARGQVEAARETWKNIERSRWDDYGAFNPFVERLKPCIDCPLPDSVTTFNKGEIMERLIRMEYDAKADPEQSASLFYKLGIAWLNMSYFGHAWEVMDFDRNGGSLDWASTRGSNIFPAYNSPLGYIENFDLSKAQDFFNRSMKLAKNPELAARAAFMGAFCEQQVFYTSGKKYPMTYNYFEKLKTEYGNTDFFQYIIEECKYFSYYVNR